MNERERFLRTLTCSSPDRPTYADYLAYDSTRARWEKEGMPAGCNMYRHFGFDHANIWDEDCIPCDWSFSGIRKRNLVEETSDYQIWIDSNGITNKYLKNCPPPAMPQHIAFPVTGHDSWLEYKKLILCSSPDYFKFDFRSDKINPQREHPIGMWIGSSYGIIRNCMGVENVSLAVYDEPGLISEMVEFFTDFYTEKLKLVLKKTTPDWVMFWEDMAYKNGSLINPKLYEDLFLSFYRKIMPVVTSAGIKVVMLDCDGNIDQLIPIWLELGISVMHPLEVAADMDVRNVRKKYGNKVKFFGGIDKRILSGGKEAIQKEVYGKVSSLLDAGGFIPACDHGVPPDVSYDNFRFYREKVRKACGE